MRRVMIYCLLKYDKEIDFKSVGHALWVCGSGLDLDISKIEKCSASRETGTQYGRPDYQRIQILKRDN